ncbi:MAG: carbonic anhydrase [Acidobacteriota bacterium]|nr:carbonic anhydrase [Acidobacteriota bacterium]
MSEVLDSLKDGLRRFRTEVYPEQASTYRKVEAEPQHPKALFITCADSRIDPGLLTMSGPGELFVSRNIGNIVPGYGEMLGGVSAVVEYAVSALKVQHIAICGHSDCGAIKGLLDPAAVRQMPTVENWLKNAHAALSVANALLGPTPAREQLVKLVTEQNVLLQLQHLRTHPAVAAGLAVGRLSISGWVYDIGAGEVRICEDGTTFEPVILAPA